MRKIGVVGLCLLAFAVALWVTCFGLVTACCSPRYPAEGFWSFEKLFWGVIPAVAGFALFARVGRQWTCLFSRRRNAWMAGGLAMLAAAFADLLLLQGIARYDDLGPPVWSAEDRLFSWGRATVRLPPGCRYERAQGIDRFVGDFYCADERATIHHDIGKLAAGHGGFVAETETLVRGSRVWTAQAEYVGEQGERLFLRVVSFPDHGCAKFSIRSENREDLSYLDEMIQSYEPKGWIPAWVLPLLPEVLRSECRQW